MKENIYGGHFLLILCYEYLKQKKLKQEKEIFCGLSECKKICIWLHFPLNY